jgi:hypothetical protein
LLQEARIVALRFTIKVVFIVVERVEPFWGRAKVIRVVLIPVIFVIGGPDKLFQSEGEVDVKW